ncbi:MAG: TadE family protein [Actinomycetota bacterium]
MVEAAFITPVFMVLVFGLLEFGLVVRDNLTVAAMTRDTARGASAFGNEQYADFKAIRLTGQAARALPIELLEKIVIFDAGSVDGTLSDPSHPAAPCKTSSTGITNVCNVYTIDDLTKPQASFGCDPATGEDRHWCPMALNGQDGREVSQSGPPDYVGVWVKVRHPFLTGLFGDDLTITDEVVMRIEPREE